MRARSVAALLGALLAVVPAGCSAGDGADGEASPPGCGMVPRGRVVGLLGARVSTTTTGSLAGLRREHRPAGCRSTSRADDDRAVRVLAQFHPAPLRLPATSCSDGWVYAGTPEKYAPACQQSSGGVGTTRLIVRWQPYLVRVTITRPDRDWAGDPETALAMSRVLAQRLGVAEAAGEG